MRCHACAESGALRHIALVLNADARAECRPALGARGLAGW